MTTRERRTCVVTGGGGPAIGCGIAIAVARSGFRVWVADVDLDSAAAVADEIRHEDLEASSIRMDTADPQSIAEAVSEVLGREGGAVHGLVNSAGIGFNAPAADMTVEDFDRIVAIDLRGPWLCAKALLPAMVASGGGSIVNVGSVHALATVAGQTAYAMCKAGLVGMTRAIAADYGRSNVRCNVIHPGAVPTRATAEGGDPPLRDVYVDRHVRRQQMLPHMIHPLDIGNAAAFLLDDRSRSITGQSIVVDGGMTALGSPNPEDA